MPRPGSAPDSTAPQLLLLSMIAIWGGSYAAVKTLLDLQVPPFVVVALRFLIAVLCLLPMLPRGQRTAAMAATWKPGVLTGTALLLGYALQTLGMRETTSSMGGFLSGLIVLLVAVSAWAVFGERLRAPTLAGLGVATIGLLLLCFGGDRGDGRNSMSGIGLQIASSTSYAAHVLMISRLSPRGREDAYCLWQLLVVAFGAALLVPATGGLGDWPHWAGSAAGIGCTLYLGLLATGLGIAVQSRVQPRIRPSQVAVLFATQPAFAAATGFLVLGERLGAVEWTGGAMIAAGVVIGSRGRIDPAPRPTAARRRRWFLFALAMLVLVLLLVAAELALRIFWQPPSFLLPVVADAQFYAPAPDEFEPLPNYTGAFLAQPPERTPGSPPAADRILTLRLNSIGLRGPELGPRRPGERRVLFVGDSLVFGHAVDEAESLPERTTAALAAALGTEVTACNGGFPGFGFTAAGKRIPRLLPKVDADAVVAALFLGNDFLDDQKQLHAAVVDGRLFDGLGANLMHSSWRGPMLVRSRLWLWIEHQLVQHAPSWSVLPHLQAPQLAGFPAMGTQTVGGLYLDALDEQRTWQAGTPPLLPRLFLHLRTTLQQMQRDTGARPLLIVLLPSLYHVDPALYAATLSRIGLVPAEYRRGLVQQRVLAVCRELGVPAFDLTPVFGADADVASLFHADKGHFSVKGNRIAGDAVAGALRTLVPDWGAAGSHSPALERPR